MCLSTLPDNNIDINIDSEYRYGCCNLDVFANYVKLIFQQLIGGFGTYLSEGSAILKLWECSPKTCSASLSDHLSMKHNFSQKLLRFINSILCIVFDI